MEYVQESVTTLHDFGGAVPEVPLAEATVVVPLADRDHASPAAERVFRTLSSLSPGSVVVALRAEESAVDGVADWLAGFDCEIELLWCNAPDVQRLLGSVGLNGRAGKGRDVWLALGVAAERSRYVIVNDADVESYDGAHVRKLLFPLLEGYAFSKGYYARVENGRLYGRLFRLFYRPLVRALERVHDAPILEYLAAFRYALAGEFGLTAEMARRLRVQRSWGLEVGTLGDAFQHAGFDGSAQVDLGRHEHSHRPVGGDGGLDDMAGEIARALFHAIEDAGVCPDYGTLPERYRGVAESAIERYGLDAAFNGLRYDAADERAQVRGYADAIAPPDVDTRLPAWTDAPIDPAEVRTRAAVPSRRGCSLGRSR